MSDCITVEITIDGRKHWSIATEGGRVYIQRQEMLSATESPMNDAEEVICLLAKKLTQTKERRGKLRDVLQNLLDKVTNIRGIDMDMYAPNEMQAAEAILSHKEQP